MELIPTFEIALSQACMELVDETGEYCEGSLRYVPGAEGAAAQEFPRVGVRLKGHMSFRTFEGKAGRHPMLT